MLEITVGIAGAAGDGLDKSGDTLARAAGRYGLHVYAYNCYQSLIRGGHIWLRLRIAQEKVYNHGDRLNALIALNQDSIERHAPEINDGGCLIFNSDRIKCDPSLIKARNVQLLALPVAEITREVAAKHGPVQAVMQNTVAVGALLAVAQLSSENAIEVIRDTFAHKGEQVIDLNVSLLQAGYDFARSNFEPIASGWELNNVKRAFCTGNEAFAMAAVAAGCKFYSAYPMTPASTILHWMAKHAEAAGVCVKQAEDELAVMNMAIGAGIAGARSMCATAGGGFALMTEAIGMAGMMEAPVVVVEVQRGGPSTGLPTKTEQADLNLVYGASQGEYPRLIIAPRDIPDVYESTVEAFHLAEKYQMPVLLMSDLLLSEHTETVDREVFRNDVKIDRGEVVKEWKEENGRFKRFKFTESGVSPRPYPGTANTLFVSGTDEHDEESILLSDMYTNSSLRRKGMEKRMRKIDKLLKDLEPPKLEGPEGAALTLVGWGSSSGVIREAAEMLTAAGISTNYLIIKYIFPFHAQEVGEILSKCKKKISVELNFTSQMARHIRAETGIAMDAHINKYDGEPFQPGYVVKQVKSILTAKKEGLEVTEEEAIEIAYHYLRTHYTERLRPGKPTRHEKNGRGEPTWIIDLVERSTGSKAAELTVGVQTGATYSYESVS